jgi:hypothetical protein
LVREAPGLTRTLTLIGPSSCPDLAVVAPGPATDDPVDVDSVVLARQAGVDTDR